MHHLSRNHPNRMPRPTSQNGAFSPGCVNITSSPYRNYTDRLTNTAGAHGSLTRTSLAWNCLSNTSVRFDLYSSAAYTEFRRANPNVVNPMDRTNDDLEMLLL